MIGYHFSGNRLRDGRPIPPIGEWLEHHGPVEPCVSGLHASEHPFDALQYAPGTLLHRVELEGDLQPHGKPIDKWVGRRRRIIASIDATDLLRAFARWCALQMIDLWYAPAVVRKYLETGDETLRATALCAAETARGAAWGARPAWCATEAVLCAADAVLCAADAAAEAAWCIRAAGAAMDAQRQRFAAMVEEAFAKTGVDIDSEKRDTPKP